MAAKQPARKRIPPDIETLVLTGSRRRCALCFHLERDFREKQGQVAHLDKRRSNSAEDNLAFLCLDHHSRYDSRTSQHKGITIHEVKIARDALYQWVKRGMPNLAKSKRKTKTVSRNSRRSVPVGCLLVSHHHVVGQCERLSFTNTGSKPVVNLTVGPLIHRRGSGTKQTAHAITMIPGAIPSIMPGATGEGKILVEASPRHSTMLVDFLREGTPESVDELTIAFADLELRRFEQKLRLTRQVDDSIRWDYSPVSEQTNALNPPEKAFASGITSGSSLPVTPPPAVPLTEPPAKVSARAASVPEPDAPLKRPLNADAPDAKLSDSLELLSPDGIGVHIRFFHQPETGIDGLLVSFINETTQALKSCKGRVNGAKSFDSKRRIFIDDLTAHVLLPRFGDVSHNEESKAQWLVRINKGQLELSNVHNHGVLHWPSREPIVHLQTWLLSASVEAEGLAPWDFHFRMEWIPPNIIKVRLP